MLATLTKVLDLSIEILNACKQQAWDDIEDIEIQRSLLVNAASKEQTQGDASEQRKISDIIHEIEQIDGEIVRLLEQHKSELLKLKKQSNSGKKMAKAYQSGK